MEYTVLSTAPFKCITCRIPLADGVVFKTHHNTEWHCHNVKRKVVDLAPLTQEQFIKIAAKKVDSGVSKNKKNSHYCNECKKKFTSTNSYENHLSSKKHKDNANSTENRKDVTKGASIEIEDEDVEEVDSDEWDEYVENPTENNQCLFCSQESGNFYKNLEHMTSFHSFFIPDIEYCTDIKGLLMYLGEKVAKDYMCLWCNEKGRTFYSVDAVQSHMVDKGHCRMIYEGVALTEYVDFYDYSSSYPDAENGVNEEEVPVDVLEGSEFQLVLPSGVTIGHRSLLRYYKQNVSRSSAIVPSKNTKKLHKVLATYRALGWSQTDQEEAARKARDVHFLKRVQSKWNMKQGIKNNKFQKHFRQQVNY